MWSAARRSPALADEEEASRWVIWGSSSMLLLQTDQKGRAQIFCDSQRRSSWGAWILGSPWLRGSNIAFQKSEQQSAATWKSSSNKCCEVCQGQHGKIDLPRQVLRDWDLIIHFNALLLNNVDASAARRISSSAKNVTCDVHWKLWALKAVGTVLGL